MPNTGSPNSNWLMIGAEIERNGRIRIIKLKGRIVCANAGYDLELAISRWLINPCPES